MIWRAACCYARGDGVAVVPACRCDAPLVVLRELLDDIRDRRAAQPSVNPLGARREWR